MLLPTTLALALLALLAPASRAQTVVLDQGTFRLTLAGREVGRDSFNVRRSGSGEEARILAQGWVDRDGRRITTIVETTGSHAFVAYHASGAGADSIKVVPRTGRFEVTVVSPAGEQTRELRARDGAVLLEENVGHQYFFVGALAREGTPLQAIVPRTGSQGRLELQAITPESVTVGGQSIDARKLSLTLDGVERHLWVDVQGRVLRVEIPSSGFVAERLRAPA